MTDQSGTNSRENFAIPESFLNKMYEFTGDGNDGGGFIIAYVNQNGSVAINCKIGSQIVEMGLRKALETFLTDMEFGEQITDRNDEDVDPDLA